MQLEIVLTTLSPTCLSSGLSFGAGEADTQTDLDGHLPTFRGRTLKGLLSEEVANVLHALNGADYDAWRAAGAELFGETGLHKPAACSFGNGTLGLAYVQAAKEWKELLTEALTIVRYQTKIDHETGTSQDGSLRSTRLMRAGLEFRFPIHIQRPLEGRAVALLAAGVACLRRVGLHRNRGWGMVKAILLVDGMDRTTELLQSLKHGKVSISSPKTPRTATKTPSAHVLQLDISLTTPAVFAKAGSEPSTVETQDYIPGSSILGAIAARWLARHKVDDPASDPCFRALFLDGTTRWLHGYPIQSGKRLLPVPKSWLHPKYDKSDLIDLASEDSEEVDDLKPLDIGYTTIEENVALHFCPEVRTSLHHRRDREKGRATEEDGALYSYQALSAGQQFRAYVLCDDERLSSELCECLTERPLSLGRSRSAGYGANAIVDVKAADSDWKEFEYTEEESDQLTVTLLSDYLGQNSAGQSDPSEFLSELARRLGVSEQPAIKSFLRTGDASGYVGAWRMPRPVSQTLAAGSVFVLPLDVSDLSTDTVQQTLDQGLGQRRAEGFGRIALNWHGNIAELRREDVSADEGFSRSPNHKTLTEIRCRVARLVLEKELRSSAQETAKFAKRVPTRSLLGRVRTRIITATGPTDVTSFLEQLKSNKNHKQGLVVKKAGRALHDCQVNKESLLCWLEGWLNKQGKPWPDSARNALSSMRLEDDCLQDDWPLIQLYLDSFFESVRREKSNV